MRRLLTVPLLLAALMLAYSAVGLASDSPVRDFTSKLGRNLTVCVSSFAPMVFCDPEKDASEYTGDVELWRRIAKEFDLKENVDYSFKCTGFGDVLESLKAKDGTCRDCSACEDCNLGCDVADTGITITVERQDEGIIFSDPYYHASLGLLVKVSMAESSGWDWIKPFTPELWICVVATLLLLPPVVFFLEFLSLRRRIRARDVPHGVNEATWRASWMFMHGEIFMVSTVAARSAVIAFAFMALIVSSTYTANLAAFLTVQQLSSAITSIDDLIGRAVASSDVYLPRLRTGHGITAVGEPLNNVADVLRVATDVRSEAFAAFVWDEPVLLYAASNISGCGLHVLQETIEPFDLGIGYRNGTPAEFVHAIDNTLIKLNEAGELAKLKEAFIPARDSGLCGFDASKINSDTQSVGLFDMYGLWVVLVAATFLGIIIMFMTRCMKRKKWAAQKAASRHNKSGGKGGGGGGGRMFRRRWMARNRSNTRKLLDGSPDIESVRDLSMSFRSHNASNTPSMSASGMAAANASGAVDAEAGGSSSGAASPGRNYTPPQPVDGSTISDDSAADMFSVVRRAMRSFSSGSSLDTPVPEGNADTQMVALPTLTSQEVMEMPYPQAAKQPVFEHIRVSSGKQAKESTLQRSESCFNGLTRKLEGGKVKTLNPAEEAV